MKITRYERYLAAVQAAEHHATVALNQMVAFLKDAKVEAQAEGFRRPTAQELASDCASLLANLKAAKCGDCSLPLTECKCAWLKEEIFKCDYCRESIPLADLKRESIFSPNWKRQGGKSPLRDYHASKNCATYDQMGHEG